MRSPRLQLLLVFVWVVHIAGASPFDDRIAALFRSLDGDLMALSPDGRRVAYTLHTRGQLRVAIVTVEPLGSRRSVRMPLKPGAAAPVPTRLRFLRWATNDRLIFAPEEMVTPLPPLVAADGSTVPNLDGPAIAAPIFATDPEGKQVATLVDARDFQETPANALRSLGDLLRTPQQLATTRNEPVHWRMPHVDVVGFLPRQREQLIISTHGAYSVPTLHAVDTHSGEVRDFASDWAAPPGEPQVFDWFRLKVVGERLQGAQPRTAWRDDDLAKVQQELDGKFPRRSVEIVDWNDTHTRILFRVTGGTDPGRAFVFQRTEDVVLEVMRQAPALNPASLHPTRFFALAAPDGTRLSGYLTRPLKPRISPPPAVVVFPSGFPGHAQPPFDPEAQVLADLGFAVVRLNHRCVREVRAQDIVRLRDGLDAAAIADAETVLQWLTRRDAGRAFDPQHVVACGRGFGGYLAARALQLRPAVFCGGIGFGAPLELPASGATESPTGRGAAKPSAIPEGIVTAAAARDSSVVAHADKLSRPLLLFMPAAEGQRDVALLRALQARLQRIGRPPDTLMVEDDFAGAPSAPNAALYRKIDAFLNHRLVTQVADSVSPKEGRGNE